MEISDIVVLNNLLQREMSLTDFPGMYFRSSSCYTFGRRHLVRYLVLEIIIIWYSILFY